jgi:hypothetical protein
VYQFKIKVLNVETDEIEIQPSYALAKDDTQVVFHLYGTQPPPPPPIAPAESAPVGTPTPAESAPVVTPPPAKPASAVTPPPAKPASAVTKPPSVPTPQFWSIGALLGTTFYAPAFTITLQGTLAPFPYSFFEIGADFGLGLGMSAANYSALNDVSYYSFYPYLHGNLIKAWTNKFHTYAGLGAGVMLATYEASGRITQHPVVVGMDVVLGMLLWNCNINVTLRTNFEAVSMRLAAGYSIRF